MKVIQEPQYRDGNIIETMLIGDRANPVVNMRDIPMESLYPTQGPVGEDNHLLEEEQKFIKELQKKGSKA